MTLKRILDEVRRLPTEQKLRLIEEVAKEAKRELQKTRRPRRSLWGLCADLGAPPLDEDIRRAREEAWSHWPRFRSVPAYRDSSRLAWSDEGWRQKRDA